MLLVKLIDLFVGVLLFLFKKERSRNPSIPLTLGAIGTAGLVVLMLASIGLPQTAYRLRTAPGVAELANASGLAEGDPVYVSGVPAGRVERVTLAGSHVDVAFRLDERRPLGNRTTATVRLRTLLGKRFLDVMPAGPVEPGSTGVIPLARTTVPFTLDEVGRQAEQAAGGVDPEALAAAMRTVAESIPPDNAALSSALAGVGSASAVFARNGESIDQLLRMSRDMSDLLVRQLDSLSETATNAAYLVSALAARRDALSQLVSNLSTVVGGLAKVYTAKQQDFGDMVGALTRVTNTLQANAAQLDQVLLKMPPAIRAVVNATGNGNWADVNSPSVVLPDNLLCALNVQRECR